MASLNSVEVMVFSALAVLSAVTFAVRLGPIVRTIAGSKADGAWRPLWGRFWREVVLQERVRRHRWAAGLAHAYVFWGFCVFGLVSVNHLASGLGYGFLGGLFGAFWEGLAMGFAVVVTLGIGALLWRRFVMRPRWLGERVSWESGLIGALIATLMVSYMLERLWGRSAPHALWWVHTGALLVFLPLLPRTKHLHLIFAPVAVLFGSGRFAAIPALAGDEDFGLETGKDVGRRLALQAYSCVECGRCQEHCPAHNTGKELNPKALVLGVRGYLNEHGAGGAAQLLGAHVSERAVFECTTCGACETQCPVGVEHLPLIVGLRRGAVNTGRWEDEYGGELFNKLERSGNPLGMGALDRERFVKKAGLAWFDGSQEYCLWLGCMGSYEARGREVVTALAGALTAAGVSFGVLKREKCTGDAARRLGNDLLFGQLAEFNLAQMAAVGVKKVVSACPHCVRTMGEDWREFGADLEVEHHSELLARLGVSGRGGEGVVYHDACYLGRYRGVYDAPRAVAAPGVEAGRNRETGFCCGAGGGLTFLGEERGTRVSHERTRELLATGATTIATACPFCRSMIEDAVGALRPEGGVRVADIAVLGCEGKSGDAVAG